MTPTRSKDRKEDARPVLAYPIYGPNRPLPYTRSSYYRWEKMGLIKLIKVGGRTMISAEDVEGILSGRIKIPQHSTRTARTLQPKGPRLGRKRK
jgi:hypothetical protein